MKHLTYILEVNLICVQNINEWNKVSYSYRSRIMTDNSMKINIKQY